MTFTTRTLAWLYWRRREREAAIKMRKAIDTAIEKTAWRGFKP